MSTSFDERLDPAMREDADCARLVDALEALTPPLADFLRFEGPDLAARARPSWSAALDQPLPAHGAGLERVLDELTETAIRYGLRTGAPGFSGWVSTAPTTVGVAASLAGMVAGSQRWWVHPFNFLETVALRWLAELTGLPATMQGAFTSSGSVANLIGLGAARQHAFERLKLDPSEDGLPAGTRWSVYVSEETHHVLIRAAAILGLGRRCVRVLPVDHRQRMDVEALGRALRQDVDAGVIPIAIVASAGTTDTGAVDPIAEIAELASQHGVWVHVDGAYGLLGTLDPETAPLFAGLERVDSAVLDPHKWLAAPVGCGAVFVRDRRLLARVFAHEAADYLEGSAFEGEAVSPFEHLGETFHDFQLDLSAPSRGVAVWAILREVGAEGIRRRVRRHNALARALARRVEWDECLELLAAPTLSICCFRYRPPGVAEESLDSLNRDIHRRLLATTDYAPSSTRVQGKFAIRACYINPRVTDEAAIGLADAVRAIGDSLVTRLGDARPAGAD